METTGFYSELQILRCYLNVEQVTCSEDQNALLSRGQSHVIKRGPSGVRHFVLRILKPR
jgi:hypothetical protein